MEEIKETKKQKLNKIVGIVLTPIRLDGARFEKGEVVEFEENIFEELLEKKLIQKGVIE